MSKKIWVKRHDNSIYTANQHQDANSPQRS